MRLDFDERDRRSVIADLESPDEEVRRLAVERAAALGTGEAVRRLVAALGDSSWRVRKAAVERLVDWPDDAAATRALIGALGDGENPGRRNSAVEALVRRGRRSLAPLLEATRHADADVRKLAVDAVAGIGDRQAIGALEERLADADSNVRAAAADALAAIGGEEAERALAALATDAGEDRLVRFSALRALDGLGVRLSATHLTGLLDDPILRPAALALLDSEEDERGLEILLKALQSGSRTTREAAMRGVLRGMAAADGAHVERIGIGVREALAGQRELVEDALRRVEEADLATRLMLVQFLGLLEVEAAVVPILCAAGDEALTEVALATLATLGIRAENAIDEAWERLPPAARRNACVLFGRTGGPRGAARLLECLSSPNPEMRTAAARSAGQRGLGDGLPELVQRLEDAAARDDSEDEEELSALTGALIALAGPRAAPDVTRSAVTLLASRLEGAPESVRLAIASVLGRIGRRDDAELVAFLLRDPGPRVRRAAVDALARLEPGSAGEPLRLALGDESPLVRMAAAAALGASQSDAVENDLRLLSRDADPLVRAAALRAIGARFGEHPEPGRRAAALGLLRVALADEAPVALTALQILRQVGRGEGAHVVAALARPEVEVVQEAVRCLGTIGAAEDLEVLHALVAHPDWSVRAEAIQALAERRSQRAIPAILRRLETEQDEFVREVILAALRRLEG